MLTMSRKFTFNKDPLGTSVLGATAVSHVAVGIQESPNCLPLSERHKHRASSSGNNSSCRPPSATPTLAPGYWVSTSQALHMSISRCSTPQSPGHACWGKGIHQAIREDPPCSQETGKHPVNPLAGSFGGAQDQLQNLEGDWCVLHLRHVHVCLV